MSTDQSLTCVQRWWRALRSEHGSNVAQAAAVALMASALIAALLLGARSLTPEIQSSFRCLFQSLGGGGGCGGAASTTAAAQPPTTQPTQRSSSPWQTFVSVGIDFIPIVGDAKGLWESITGRDTITGEELSTAERILGLAGIVGLSELRLLARADNVVGAVRAVDRAGDAADAGNDGRRAVDRALEVCGIGAAPTDRGRGLAKPLAAPCRVDINDPGKVLKPKGFIENPNRPGSWGMIDPNTGKYREYWRYDKAEPGKPGWRGKDHVHHYGGKEHLDPSTPFDPDAPFPP